LQNDSQFASHIAIGGDMTKFDKIERFAAAMLDAAELDDLLWTIAKNIGEILAFDDCVIYLKEGHVLKQKAAFGVKNPNNRKLLHEISIDVGCGIVGFVAKSGVSEIVAQTSTDERYIWDEFSGQSELTVPILYEGETIGIIDSESAVSYGYSEKDKQLLQVIASIASPRIVSAQYCCQLQRTQFQLKESNQQLELTIKQLKQNQESLVQSEKMASVGLLAAGIAHEVNNPLGFSLSNLSIMNEYYHDIKDRDEQLLRLSELPLSAKNIILAKQYGDITSDMQSIINETHDGLIRIKGIVADLCGYVRTQDKHNDWYDINDIVNVASNLLRGEVKSPCQLKLNLEAIPPLYGNSGKINQVLMNVMLNAIQASPKGGHIKVSTYVHQNNAYIEISDNGVGIDPKHINDIFTPFFTTKPVGQGTGLGLFICYKIINDEHDGDIKVVSTNNGATFRITLPLLTNSQS
jgi:signal transduction histidine kinase